MNLAGYRKIDGSWTSLGRLRIGRPGGFFWKVLTGPRSISEFSVSADSPERATVRLLMTSSLGWSPLYRVHVSDGRLVAG